MTRRRLLPPVYLLISIVLMVALHLVVPVRLLIGWPYRYLGVVLLVVGFGVNIWPGLYFKTAKTTVLPFERASNLVTGGPFRLSRNPMYVGMVVMLMGVAVLLGSVTPWALVLAFAVVIDRRFIVFEEKAMEETFGDAYRQYKKRVRHWI